MSQIFHGSCLCGSIRFSVRGFQQQAANCHCTMCRKFHGAAFGTLVGVQGLNWISGQALLKDYVADNGTIRSFCPNCGASLGFRGKEAPLEAIELAIATFDEDIPVTIDAQIYTAYKANWCELNRELPAFAEGRET
ncbi:GFA family protein [Photobacterium sp. 1_MG-2023]|uniref:GFA family protein n=1 Tax=Photobacterium sp. 1_MG-2023 TaxID=3062646 RepID=UPI0026E36C20|nr:GFA family protein [Photobacterium sp. 1_MG-2023]MDO6707579.1 GFA family protein [Photobacterium sp. 1_MG-2023]